MFRTFRPAFENLEKREVFSALPLIGLGNIGATAPRTEPIAYHWGAMQSAAIRIDTSNLADSLNAAPQSEPSAIGPNITDYAGNVKAAPQSEPHAVFYNDRRTLLDLKAAPQSQPSAISGTYDPSTGILTAVPQSGPSAAADFDNDGDVDGADFIAARSAAESHDAFFTALGMPTTHGSESFSFPAYPGERLD